MGSNTAVADASSSGSLAESSTGPSGTAQLWLSDGPTYDFGDVELGEASLHALTVTNVGDGLATGLVGGPLRAPYAYRGGVYPGIGGDCGDVLEPLAQCQIMLELRPDRFGPTQTQLQVVHDLGDASIAVQGRGVGSIELVLANPGGERTGAPPPGWTDAGPGAWIAASPDGVVLPFEGRSVILSDLGPNGAPYMLQQLVAIDDPQWLTLVDRGELQAAFVGRARSRAGSDGHRLRLQPLDARGEVLDDLSSPWSDVETWESVALEASLPVGTRSVLVELGCLKVDGTRCSAYFDALQLHAVYP